MGEEAITSGRQKALREATILLDLAIIRSRGNLLDAGLRSRSGVLESGQSRGWQLTTPYGAANDDAHKEVTTMWSKLFGGGDGLPREKADAVVHVIDRYLDDMTPDDASESGSIVTAPRHAEQKERNGTWRVLAKLSVSSEPGNERLAMERVAAVVKELGLSEQRLERLKTAVAEATMNAMEHGNRYRSEVPVVIEVLSSGADLSVRINDQGGIRDLAPDKEVPNLETKLEGLQTPRGWGLFLIRTMVDEIHISTDEVNHTVELVMHL